jgi:ribosomal protein S18 acetylase RimI-like enzyme
MGHLLAEAKELAGGLSGTAVGKPQWLVLMVHRDNARAIRFYEHCGFELIPDVVRRNDHLVMKLWISE